MPRIISSKKNIPGDSRCISQLVGSETIAKGALYPRSTVAAAPIDLPSDDSSPTTDSTQRSPFSFISQSMRALAAQNIAALPPFVSLDPRPHILPSDILPLHGSYFHCTNSVLGTGTTSQWPCNINDLPPSLPWITPTTLGLIPFLSTAQ
ncbi:hypothetical protein ES703_39603 [subsurface metagenome]